MHTLRDMTNLKNESYKFYKKLYKQLNKLDEVLGEEKTMRHTPSEEEQQAWDKFRKYLKKQEKFLLADLVTILEIGKEEPTDPVGRFKERKQIRIESHSFKDIFNDILETDNMREYLDKGLDMLNKADFAL